MIFTRKMNTKLAIIGVTFMALIILTNGFLMEYGLKRSVEFTYEAHHAEAEEKLKYDIDLLKDIANKISENEKIVGVLEKNRIYDDLDLHEKLRAISEIEHFEGYLKNLTFVNTINIASESGKYLFTNGGVVNNFNLAQRPWFKEAYFNEFKDTIITDIHMDYNTGKYTIALVKLIYSQVDGTLLGAAILDIFLDDLIKSLNSDFYMGDLNTYIKISGDTYYGSDGLVDINNIIKNCDNYIVKLDDVLKNNLEIFFEFDKDSIIYTKEMRRINIIRIMMFSFAGIIYVIILICLAKKTLSPIVKSLDKLKILLKNLDKSNFDYESNDEFEQLEFISNSLSKSFDKKIQSLIYYDELTKLPNRKLLYKMCNDLISAEVEFALIFVDLNKFKYINDVFGHSIGDDLLVNFSCRMEKILNDKGIITRYSGDEFIIIYHRYTSINELQEFYQNDIVNAFNEPIVLSNGKKVIVEFSAGAAVYPKDGDNFEDLIDKSDFMMYSSKKISEENKLLLFNDDIYNNIIKIENIKQALKSAIKNDEFILHYQPIVDRERKLKKLEALIRWDSKKLGFISPAEFIGYAEETGEIVKIGYWTIEEVCKNFVNFEGLQVSINVSPIQLMELDFAHNVKKITDKYDVDIRNLCFEITESVVIDENTVIHDNINLLHRFGGSIALDDFGTGYASFSYLRKFKLDVLKIDKSLIGTATKIDYEIIYNISNIANLLEMDIVIEGVETERQFEILCQVGCKYFQGYCFAKPMKLDDLICWTSGVQ